MAKAILYLFGMMCFLLACAVPICAAYVGETVEWLRPSQWPAGWPRPNGALLATSIMLIVGLSVAGIAACLAGGHEGRS